MKTADFAAHLTEFLSHYLPELKNISTNTISSYCDAFRLCPFKSYNEAESSGTSFGFSSTLNAFLAEKPEYNGVVEKFWVSKSIAHYVKQLRQESSPGAVFTSVLLITTMIK